MKLEEIIIDYIKMKSYGNTAVSIVGLKIITDESLDTIMNTIERDIHNYNDVYRFLVHENTIKIGLSSNATAAIFYFMNTEKMETVKIKLKELCESRRIIYKEF